MPSLPKKVIFPAKLFIQEVDNEIVILDTETEQYYGLDEVGKIIWDSLNEFEGEVDKTVTYLLNYFDIDPETLYRDLNNFISQLEQNRLIQTVS